MTVVDNYDEWLGGRDPINHVTRWSRSAVPVLVETGSRHMSTVAPASDRRIDGRITEAGSHRMSRIAPGSRHRP